MKHFSRMWKQLGVSFLFLVVWQHASFVFGTEEYSPAYAIEKVANLCMEASRTVGAWTVDFAFWTYDGIKAFFRAIKLYEMWQSTTRLVHAFLELGFFWFGWIKGAIQSLRAHLPKYITGNNFCFYYLDVILNMIDVSRLIESIYTCFLAIATSSFVIMGTPVILSVLLTQFIFMKYGDAISKIPK